jgi:signal transduction histidine kinase
LIKPLPRSSLFTRFALAVAGLAVGATILLYFVTMQIVVRAGDAELSRAVDTEIAALADVHATGGQRELAARIADRLALLPDGPDRVHYMLADATGTRVVGDIARWPLLSAENSQASFVTLFDGTPVFARATQLAPNLRLVAAREYGGRQALLRRLRFAFLVTGIAILAAALATAWAAARRLRMRVESVNRAFVAIEEGDLNRPIPDAAASDEFGMLARHANRLRDRLAALIAAQRDITDHVAHEIRTPLMHVENRLLKLIDRSVDPAQIEMLVGARAETRDISNLLNSLLDIAASRARRGDRTGFAPIDLSGIAREIVDLYADSADDQGLTLHATIPAGVEMTGDAMQIRRLLSNLLDNAFKYVPRGGRITLTLWPGPRIVVEDNGPGVVEALRERIFDRFQRAHDGSRNGHGLGLTLARAIAERHGLTIRCDDAGPGAAFILEPGPWA